MKSMNLEKNVTSVFSVKKSKSNFSQLYFAQLHKSAPEPALCTLYTAMLYKRQCAGHEDHARHGGMRSVQVTGFISEKIRV